MDIDNLIISQITTRSELYNVLYWENPDYHHSFRRQSVYTQPLMEKDKLWHSGVLLIYFQFPLNIFPYTFLKCKWLHRSPTQFERATCKNNWMFQTHHDMGTATQNLTYQDDQGKPWQLPVLTIDLFSEQLTLQIHAQNFWMLKEKVLHLHI